MRTMTKEQRLFSRYRPVGYTNEMKTERGVVWMTPGNEPHQFAIAYRGTAGKPEWHHSFKTHQQAVDHAVKWLKSMDEHAAFVSKWRSERFGNRSKTVADVYAKALAGKCMDDTDVAVLIRAKLNRAFPDTKFKVRVERYSMGSSIHVGWSDGPSQIAVENLIGGYGSKNFDGMIDMGYHVDMWLTPDGDMSVAHDPGTEGSKGSCSEHIGSAPHPGAVLVRGGTDYVHANRRSTQVK